MTCGITVAPMIPVASRMLSVPAKPGTNRCLATWPPSGCDSKISKREGEHDHADHRHDPGLEPAEAHLLQAEDREGADAGEHPGGEQRDPEQQVEARAPRPPPRRCRVGMATTSAWIQSPIDGGRRKVSRQSSGRFLPVAMPSFADWVWTTIAIRLAARTTQSSR